MANGLSDCHNKKLIKHINSVLSHLDCCSERGEGDLIGLTLALGQANHTATMRLFWIKPHLGETPDGRETFSFSFSPLRSSLFSLAYLVKEVENLSVEPPCLSLSELCFSPSLSHSLSLSLFVYHLGLLASVRCATSVLKNQEPVLQVFPLQKVLKVYTAREDGV